MRKQVLAAVLLVSSLLSVTACKKKTDDPTTTPTGLSDAQEFVNKYMAPKQSFDFNVSDLPLTITLSGGTKITLQPNSMTINGVAVTGNLKLEAYEVLKRSKVIMTGTNTNHISGAPLASDGFIYVDIKRDGVSIDQVMNLPYEVKIPTTREGEFTRIWTGETEVNGQNQMAWAPPMNGGMDSVKALDSVFGFSVRDLGWTNCDIFYQGNAPKTTVTVTVNNNPGPFATFMGGSGTTYVLFCAQGQNVVAQLYTPAGTNMVKSYDNSMPIGATGRLLAFAIKDGKFFMAKQDVTITANMATTLALTELTEEALTAEIAALDSY